MVSGAVPAAIVPSAHENPPLHAPLADTNVSPAGVGCVMVTLTASDGPPVATVIAYATLAPGVACTGPLFESCRSAVGATVTALVAASFSVFGSVTPAGGTMEAVLTRTPSVPDAIVPAAVNVAVCPTWRSTVVAMFPAPDGEPQADPPSATHVQSTVPNAAGNASMTLAPLTALGPLFVTTME